MKELTLGEKEYLQRMLDKHAREQSKKRKTFREFKAELQQAKNRPIMPGRGHDSARFERKRASAILRRIGNHEEKLQRLHQRTQKASILKQIQLTEKEKEELKAKIRENQSLE